MRSENKFFIFKKFRVEGSEGLSRERSAFVIRDRERVKTARDGNAAESWTDEISNDNRARQDEMLFVHCFRV